MHRNAFTLIEILATLLLLSFGLMSALGMISYATRVSGQVQNKTTAMLTARGVMLEPEPVGLVADVDDANGDGWFADGGLTAPSDKSYQFKVWGFVNGYYLMRDERSTEADIIDAQTRYATITVQVYSGDQELTTIQRRLLRRTEAP